MSNARRVSALSKKPKRPKFALGTLVIDPHDKVGAITAVYVDLLQATKARIIQRGWLALQRIRPKTPSTGIWYSVLLRNQGAVLVGEKDLRRAPKRR